MLRNRICDPYASVLIRAATPGRANCVTENIDMKPRDFVRSVVD